MQLKCLISMFDKVVLFLLILKKLEQAFDVGLWWYGHETFHTPCKLNIKVENTLFDV